MPLFKRRDKNEIPAVEAEGGGSNYRSSSSTTAPSYRSNASTYVASRDGDLSYDTSSYKYNQQPPPAPIPDSTSGGYSNTARRYGPTTGVGDVYTRGGFASGTAGAADLDRDRSELFSGYDASKPAAGSGRFFDGPGGPRRPDPQQGEETEEDVEAIKKDIRWTKQESANSTRNALRMAREAEETGRSTLLRLGDQSGGSHFILFSSFTRYMMELIRFSGV